MSKFVDKARHLVGELGVPKGRPYQIAVKEVLQLISEASEEAYKAGKEHGREEMREEMGENE